MGTASAVRTAIIPAAGRGTRWLPFTRSVPKELLPVGPTPVLQLVIDECVGAGIDHVVVVTSTSKPALRDYLDQLDADLRVSYAFQDEPLGLGHAVGCGRDHVGDQPFAVLLPDEIYASPELLSRLIGVCTATGGSAVGLTEVADADVERYGIVVPADPTDADAADGVGDVDAGHSVGGADGSGVIALASMVEKPAISDAPSNLAIIGRYVLTPDIFDHIDATTPGALGEIQLTDGLRRQAESGPFHGVVNATVRYDTGTPDGWFEAVVDWMLADQQFGQGAAAWLRRRVAGLPDR